MYCILQTLLDKRINDVVLYLGIKEDKLLVKDAAGRIYAVDEQQVTCIRDNQNKIHVGRLPREWGTEKTFFGYLKPEFWNQVEPDTSLRKYIRREGD